jgi:WD40 repeat protein
MAPQGETRLNVSGRSWSSQLLPVLALLAAALCQIGTGHAEQENEGLPTGPILRIETGLHGGLINRIDTDAANRFAVTSSDDKTVRVWSLPEGWLLRILRLPLDSGNAGKAYAVAISPDGGTIAAGGWTGSQGHFNIFLFDRASGEQTKRLADLPNTVQAGPPDQSERFEAALKDAVAKRVAFTSFVTETLVPHTEGAQKGIAGDFIKGGGDLIKALTDAGIAIWREFRSSGEARRKEIMQELESLRWPRFTVPSGK